MAEAGEDRPGVDLEGISVLLVEDQVIVAMDMQMSLEDAGATVIGPATRLDEALAAAQDTDRHIDAAVLDVDLHGEEVFEVADALTARGVPFLFQTGHASRDVLGPRWPDAPVCIKPMLTEDLVRAVSRLIAAR